MVAYVYSCCEAPIQDILAKYFLQVNLFSSLIVVPCDTWLFSYYEPLYTMAKGCDHGIVKAKLVK